MKFNLKQVLVFITTLLIVAAGSFAFTITGFYQDGNAKYTGAPVVTADNRLLHDGTKIYWSVTIEFKGHGYGLVTGANNRVWLDRNLGADRVATASSDSQAYGGLYQWGRLADGHQGEGRSSSSTSTKGESITPDDGDGNKTKFIIAPNAPHDWLKSGVDDNGALRSAFMAKTDGTGLCPLGFRVPTDAEWEAERGSWSSNNSAGAYASPLKLSVPGYRYHIDASSSNVGSEGYYWNSTANGSGGRHLHLEGSSTNVRNNERAYGFSVRCIKD